MRIPLPGVLALTLVLTPSPRPTAALTWDVPGDASTIAAGIDSAAAGDTVLVTCGTYYEFDISMKSGVVLRSENGDPTCVTIDATGDGGFFFLACDSTTVLEGFTLTGGWRGFNAGNTYISGGAPRISHCRFTGNAAGDRGGAVFAETDAHPVFSACDFDNNSAEYGGAVGADGGSLLLEGCTVYGNVATIGGGGVFSGFCATVLADCLIYGNSAATNGGGVWVGNSSGVSIAGCTISGNGSPGAGGGGIFVTSAIITVDRSIIALSPEGGAVDCSLGGTISFSCSNLFGNIGGDWGSCGGTAGVDGNFSADPLFCDAASNNFSLFETSPCLPGQHPDGTDCGLIGAVGQGCAITALIASVSDIPEDQGGQVRVTWSADSRDTVGADPAVVEYVTWRRVDDAQAQAAGQGVAIDLEDAFGAPVGMRQEARGEPVVLLQGGTLWEPVGPQIPAMQWTEYASVVPTLADSSIADGMHWSVFFVSAHTTDPHVYYSSPPDSGYSVDNLCPSVPTGLQLAVTALTWDSCPDADFDYFTVYGSDTGDFGEAVPIGYAVDPEMDVGASPYAWYHVTATDFDGNESGDAVIQCTVVAAEIVRSVPTQYDLRAARPSPFAERTAIAFDTPQAGRATLRIYDVAGRLVRTLIDRHVGPGRHSLTWDGRDTLGTTVSAGVYLVRFDANDFHATRKLVRLQ